MFTRFGTMVDERTRKVIEHGRRIRAVLAQRQFEPLSLGDQAALLCALNDGVLDGLPLDRVAAFRAALGPWLPRNFPEICALDDRSPALSEEARVRLRSGLMALAQPLTVSKSE